ncbi:uncharacterized protein LOC125226514 [Leguminivora glycinivorella]|uniref:uncharacterized protein LOC125226514 n=1 Tax=Leguminivora glycinivorella TaxID=1035111 RepID=UPI00200C847F|nr:uncharacterized protein LOC125226514 [Leguminivora glycinivorella]
MFQDNLLLMQVELETALDKVTDSLMSPKEDAAAVAQTVEVFLEYKSDLVHTRVIQLDLNTDMEKYLTDLGFIMKKIEYLRNRKCTRQQMFEALGDKLTLKDINGLLTQAQFGAVTTNNREVLQNVNMKIFSKECDWQYAIDTFVTKSSSCADILQLKSFSDSIQQVFGEIDVDLNEMFKIATPFKTYATNKTIQRDEKCLSCGAPVEVEKTELNLKLWQELVSTAAVPAKKSITLKYEDLCIPGLPIPHPLEQGSYICQHDCGEIVKTEESLELYIRKLKPDAQPHIKAVPEKVNNKTQTEYR